MADLNQTPHARHRLSRRHWLTTAGALGVQSGIHWSLGLTGANKRNSARAESSIVAPIENAPAKRCIILFLLGGPPQHETWDPKPDAPAEVRGPYQPIQTATPGLFVNELMPRLSQLTERIAVLRAMSTNDNAHSSSGYWMLTGTPHTPTNSENATPGAPNDGPCLAALVNHLSPEDMPIPASIRLPEEIWNTGRIVWPGQDAGRLGRRSDPWLLTCHPHEPNFSIPDLAMPIEISADRFQNRRHLLDFTNQRWSESESASTVQHWDLVSRQALGLLQTTDARGTFDLEQESPELRDRYGRNRFGQSVLLARRMIESGVRVVQVNWPRWETDTSDAPAWDNHARNAERLKNDLMPPMDHACATLLEDLSDRGLLDETLVILMGEFGRTPRINGRGGRDHWGHVFSVALAGGGIRGGIVHGASDPIGAFPKDGRVEPQDLAATLFHSLGYQHDMVVHDAMGRPMPLSNGHPIRAIL